MTPKFASAMVLAVGLLWGSEWLFHNTLAGVPTLRALALRCFIAACFLILPTRRMRERSTPMLANILIGCITTLPALFLTVRTDLSPGLVVLCFATIPIITAILESNGGLTNAIPLLGGLAGTAFLVRGGLSFSLTQSISSLGLLFIAVLLSMALIKAKTFVGTANIAGCVLTQMLGAGVVFMACSLSSEGTAAAALSLQQIGAIVILGLLGNAAGYSLFYVAMRNRRVSQVTAVQWFIPVVGILETAIVFRHLPTWDVLLGGAVAVVSAGLLLQAPQEGGGPLTLQITGVPDRENGSR